MTDKIEVMMSILSSVFGMYNSQSAIEHENEAIGAMLACACSLTLFQYSCLLQKYLQSADSTSAAYLHRNIWCLYREHTTQVSSFPASYGGQERPEHTGST